MAGDVPPPLADGAGMFMFIGEPPIPMLWCTATHQVHTAPAAVRSPVGFPFADPFAENELSSKMYWENGPPSTLG